jgi:predicted RNA-binding protein
MEEQTVMCETNAYVIKNGNEELFLENVDLLRPVDGSIFLKNLFGEQKSFKGSIKEISLSRHKIVLEKD